MDPAFFTVRTPRARTHQQQLACIQLYYTKFSSSSCFQRSRACADSKKRVAHPACMNRHVCWMLLLAAGCFCLLLLLLVAAAGCCTAAASSSSSSNQQPAASISSSSQQQAAAEQQQPAWLLHGHDAASKPGCMVHGMRLLQNRDAWCMASCCFSSSSCCCVHACVRGCLRGRHRISADTSAQTRAWRTGFSYGNIAMLFTPS